MPLTIAAPGKVVSVTRGKRSQVRAFRSRFARVAPQLEPPAHHVPARPQLYGLAPHGVVARSSSAARISSKSPILRSNPQQINALYGPVPTIRLDVRQNEDPTERASLFLSHACGGVER